VMYFDINGMKTINDTLGHGAGDAALKKITETIHENIRTSDVAGRLGGDEFAVILVQTDNATALTKARQLEEAVAANPLIWEQQAISLETAVGVHTIQEGDTALSALDTADRAMYVHKITRKGGQLPR
jgi:diguanylate cyclase (GGDEF)-like protein